MNILVTFAVQAEFAPWRRMRNFTRISGTEFFLRSGDVEVHAFITGIRARNLRLPAADICVASGVAGSLKAQYQIGSVLVAKAIRQDSAGPLIRSDESLVETAIQCGAEPVELFHTADNIVSKPSEKSRLGRIADAVDMESYTILGEARQRGIPAVAIRAISDAADQELPLDFDRAIDRDGKIEWLPALSQVAASPGSLPQLMRFGLQSSKAARKLAEFLDKYLECLAAEAHLLTTGMENTGA